MNGFDEILDLQHKLLEEIKTYAVENLEVGVIYKLDTAVHIVNNISCGSFEIEDLSDDNYDIYLYCESKDEKSINSQAPGLYLYDLNVYQLTWFLKRLVSNNYFLNTLNQ